MHSPPAPTPSTHPTNRVDAGDGEGVEVVGVGGQGVALQEDVAPQGEPARLQVRLQAAAT